MANDIDYAKVYTRLLDKVYTEASLSTCLNSPRGLVRETRGGHEIMVPKISVTGLGDYTRNVGYKTGSIDFSYETETYNYDHGICLMADVMDVEETGVMDAFAQAGAELERSQVAPEADAFCFTQIASHEGVTVDSADLSAAKAVDVLGALRDATNAMDEVQVSTGSRILFITPTLKGTLDDYAIANPTRSNRVLERFNRIVEVP